MTALDTKALRALATKLREVHAAACAAAPGSPALRAWRRVDGAVSALSDALSPDVVLALLDRLERAERIAPSVEAGELVDAVLGIFGISRDDGDQEVEHAAMLVQRALDAAEERGAEAEREHAFNVRRHGADR